MRALSVSAPHELRVFSNWRLAVIIIDFGRLGKAKLHRPTWLELLGLLAVLGFVAVIVFRR